LSDLSRLQNGLILCALVKNQYPEADIQLDALNKVVILLMGLLTSPKENHVANVELAFTTAEKHLGIRSDLSIKDVADGRVDDDSLLEYLSNFLKLERPPKSQPTPLPMKIEKQVSADKVSAPERIVERVVEKTNTGEIERLQKEIASLMSQLASQQADLQRVRSQARALQNSYLPYLFNCLTNKI
jgi:hypothetical protein